MKKIKNTALILLVLISTQLSAGIIEYNTYKKGGDLENSTGFSLKDMQYDYMQTVPTWPNEFTNVSVQNRVILEFTGQEKEYYAAPWVITANFNVNAYDENGQLISSASGVQQLEINYDPSSDYQDINLYAFKGANFVEVTGLTLTKNGITAVPEDVFLRIETEVNRQYAYDRNTVPTISSRNPNNGNAVVSTDYQAELYWNYIDGATEYDLEWYWLDGDTDPAYVPTSFSDIRDLSFSRVTVSSNNYVLNLSYDKGTIYYRVRAVGRYGADFSCRKVGEWSNDFTNNHFDVDNLHEDKNWSYQSAFAEEGKKKEVVSYADGTTRTRQTVTRNNSDNNAIIAETFYDYEGRAVINTLPTPDPLRSDRLMYYPNFNLELNSGSALSKVQYDYDNQSGSCGVPDLELDPSTTGSSNYYSDQNAYKEGFNAYIPSAENYPYVRSAFDKYGRTNKQSGAGATHKMEGGHDTKIFYVKPSQKKLDRLFGNEVGLAKHYELHATQDANGQVSFVYSNFGGQKVASSLIGEAPDGITPLESNTGATTIVEDLHDFNNYVQAEESRIIDYTKFIEVADTHYFVYNLVPATFAGLCDYDDQTGLDFPCEYDLKITIFDACDNALYENSVTGQELILHEQIFHITSNTDYSLPLTFEVDFPAIGTYKIEKRLSLNDSTLQAHLDSFNLYLRDENYQHDCIDNLSDLTNDYLEAIDWTNCYDCETYCDSFPNLCDPDECDINSVIASQNNCSSLLQQLGSDLSPGGQYFENDPDPTSPNAWLVSNLSGDLSSITSTIGTSTGLATSSWSWDDIRNNWSAIQSQWSNTTYVSPEDYMATFHPEYCHYEWCVLTEPSVDFTISLAALDFAGAVSATYANNSTSVLYNNLIAAEPLNPAFVAIENDLLNEIANDYEGTGTDLWNFLVNNNAGMTNDELWQAFVGAYNGLKEQLLEDYKRDHFNGGCGYLQASPITLANSLPNTTTAGGFTINVFDFNNFIEDNELTNNNSAQDWGTNLLNMVEPCIASITINLDEEGMDPCSGSQSTTNANSILFVGGVQISDVIPITCPSSLSTWAAEIEAAVLSYGYPGLTITVSGLEITITLPDPNQDLDNEAVYLIKGNSSNPDFYFLFGQMETNCTVLEDCFCTELQLNYDYIEGENPSFNANDIYQFMADDYNASYTSVNITTGQIAQWMESCAAEGTPVIGINSALVIPSELLANCNFEEAPCDQNPSSIALATYHANFEFERQIQEQLNQFRETYVNHCFNVEEDPASVYEETFTIEGADYEYHYTLYYYDRAGNLVRTVPPEGVEVLDATAIAATQAHRATPDDVSTPFVRASHTFVTSYEFNSLNQLVAEEVPDAESTNGVTKRYWYDKIGRIAVSQDALQLSYGKAAYSYLLYDGQGRIVESGEVLANSDPTEVDIADPTFPDNWHNLNDNGQKYRRQVTQSIYDEAPANTPFTAAETQYLRSRVAATYYWDRTDDKQYEFASHYSYDEHGYVNSLINENTYLAELGQDLKRMDYEYDLISGNTNKVTYQGGEWDQFIHQYCYDADNRITRVLTSRDGQIWDKEARYLYYEHGPMARTEIGDKKVQGNDYAYNIQGWLKSVNANRLNNTVEMGKDGARYINDDGLENFTAYNTAYQQIHQNVAVDATAFSLGYYDNDYQSISATNGGNNFWNDINNINTGANYLTNLGNNLYNGNIRHMTTHMLDFNEKAIDLAANFYHYDQLQRIKGMDVYLSATNSFTNATNNGDYATAYSFDANGNLNTLERLAYTETGGNNPHTNEMDEIEYFYYGKDGNTYQVGQFGGVEPTNRLAYVTDGGDNPNTAIDFGDIKNNQTAGNYRYNNRGDLVFDFAEEIGEIEWYQAGKVKSITRTANSDQPDLYFHYDAMGQRSIKIVKPRINGQSSTEDQWKYTFYSRDASGNVMAVYERSFITNSDDYEDQFGLKEFTLYGSDRLGLKTIQEAPVTASFTSVGFDAVTGKFEKKTYTNPLITGTTTADFYQRTLGQKQYECKNHLGNVLTVVTDRIIGMPENNVPITVIAYYTPDVVSYSDYYPYGMQMPNRSGSSGNYRYGFNGMEKDGEIKGEGDWYDTEFRVLDPRIGRWLSLDPIVHHGMSPYNTFDNNPIYFKDPSGSNSSSNGGVGQPSSKEMGVSNDTEIVSTENAAMKINGAVKEIIGEERYNDLEENDGDQMVVEGSDDTKAIFANGNIIETGTSTYNHNEIDGTGILDDYDVWVSTEVIGMVILPSASSGNVTQRNSEYSLSESATENFEETGGADGKILKYEMTVGNETSWSKEVKGSDGQNYYEYDVMLKVQVSVSNEIEGNKMTNKNVWIRTKIKTQMSYTAAEMGF